MQHSYWTEYSLQNHYPSLKKDLNTDILIIGGGITGITTAYYLQNSKYRVCLIEKDEMGKGVTSLTTGKVSYLQGLNYHKIAKKKDYSTSYQYLNSQLDAIKLIKEIIAKEKISCQFERKDAFVFTKSEKDLKDFKEEENFFQRSGISFQKVSTLPNGFPILYGLKLNNSYDFHPLRYLDGLLSSIKGVDFFEHTMATSIQKKEGKYLVSTKQGVITCSFVVVATHYPFFLFPALVPFKTTLEKTHLLASSSPTFPMQAIESSTPSITMRYYQDLFLFGGNSYCPEKEFNMKKKKEEIEDYFHEHFSSSISYEWSIFDIMTFDHLPLIGEVKPQFYLATGYNKWGMTNGTLAGKIISDLLLKKENPYCSLFDPKRAFFLSSIPAMVTNAQSFLKTKLFKNQPFYNDKVTFQTEGGVPYAIYEDEKGIHKVINRCPHMKCSLLFNEKEKVWDCPCHGSKYDLDGHVLKGPSTQDITPK